MLASDFPGSSVDENPSANAGDMDSIPGPGRLHVLQSSQACVPHPLSRCTLTTEAHVPRVWAPQQEKPPQWEAEHPTEGSHCSQQEEKAHTQQQRPSAVKN